MVHAAYKERLEQPYVFAELRGSYTRTGRALEGLQATLEERGLVASGPPFALYFDDPGRLNSELDRLRAVTVDQIRAFARERLGQDNRAVLTYEPRRDGKVSR